MKPLTSFIRWFDDISNRQVLFILTTLAAISFLLSILFHVWSGDGEWMRWADSVFQTFGNEVLGALMTFALLEVLVGARNKRDALASQSRTEEPEKATEAVHALAQKEWIKATDLHHANLENANFQGTNLQNGQFQEANLAHVNFDYANLKGALLENADLHQASIKQADLQNATMDGANLQSSDLRDSRLRDATLIGCNLHAANLENAGLESTNMRHANLEFAILKKANLESTNFKNANLKFADLSGANFLDTHLEGAHLEGANLDNASWLAVYMSFETVLPDGSYWSDDTDITRFIDPDHPEYWKKGQENVIKPKIKA